MKEVSVIGRVEIVSFPSLGITNVPAKIDTGADFSSIWCGRVLLDDVSGVISCVFFDKTSKYFTGNVHVFERGEYTITRVASSFGSRQLRYKVKIPVKVGDRLLNATFTLAERSTKLYPVLIGRSMLNKKFLVDVSKGSPLRKAEKERKAKMLKELSEITMKVKK